MGSRSYFPVDQPENNLTIAMRCFFYSFDQTLLDIAEREPISSSLTAVDQRKWQNQHKFVQRIDFQIRDFSNLCFLLFVDTT